VKSDLHGSTLGVLLERIPHQLRDEELPFYFSHGDFVPWNTLIVEERPFLFDWEYARPQWLPGYDLFHFLFQTRLLLAKESPACIFREILEQVTHWEAIRAYWQRLEILEQSIGPLMLLYLLDRAVYHTYLNPGQYRVLQRILVLTELGFAELGWFP
jgi:aminoglycoside phosphotransferase (APT) family kinase protein